MKVYLIGIIMDFCLHGGIAKFFSDWEGGAEKLLCCCLLGDFSTRADTLIIDFPRDVICNIAIFTDSNTLYYTCRKSQNCFLKFDLILKILWTTPLTLSVLLKPPPRKLVPSFVLWSFILLRLLCISINLLYSLAWNIAIAGLVLLATTRNC